MYLPADDFLLLSLINTKLRDEYSSLSELCEEEDVAEAEIRRRLQNIGYEYSAEHNAFK